MAAERTLTTTLVGRELTTATHYVALRTIHVIVSNGARKLKVNALLDDARTKIYINSDVASELGLKGEVRENHSKCQKWTGKCIQINACGVQS